MGTILRSLLRGIHLWVLAFAVLSSAAGASGGSAPTSRVTGRLTQVDGLPVLTVWGTAYEQGFAHGYLLAERVPALLENMLKSGVVFTPDSYQNGLLAHINIMKIEAKHEQELRGMLAGMEAKLGGPGHVPALGRAVRYDDLVALNSMDLRNAGFNCSSFAAWGPMTEDGHTITGRNWEWPLDKALFETQFVLVRLPSKDDKTPGLVSLFFPTCIGTSTAMNGDGVTVAMHDVVPRQPTVQENFVCRMLTHREALEKAHASTFTQDIGAILRQQHSFMGENVFVSRPFAGAGPGAVVFEHDGYLPEDEGVALREPPEGASFVVCTNHYRKREQARPQPTCPRYATIARALQEIADSHGEKHVTVEAAWRILESAPISGLGTYHRVVFEPDKRLMHVALPENGDPQTRGKVVTLDVARLLQPAGE